MQLSAIINRRHFVQAGILGAAGLGLADYLRLAHAAGPGRVKAQSVVFVWLGGGPPHLDTFDLKPDAPAEVRGEFKPIKTNVAGIEVCEHLPRLARCADRYALVRSVTHTLAGHALGTEYLNTGNRPLPSLTYPGLGAVISKERPAGAEMPAFVAVPTTPQKAGYLGVRHAPLQTNTAPVAGRPFSVRGITLPAGVTVADYERRHSLLGRLDSAFSELKDDKLVEGLDQFGRQAHAMITSARAREAFDISREKPERAKPFGTSSFGTSCLLALRLVEAGTRFVTVSFGGWDTHAGNFRACQTKLLPQLDEGLSALLCGLSERGLLESTLLCVTGEFGRTPKINARAGRDHWPRAMSVLFAGGGVRAGQVIGATDGQAMGPKGDGFTPEQVATSIYQSLGIDVKKEHDTATGRPIQIVRGGTAIPGLFA